MALLISKKEEFESITPDTTHLRFLNGFNGEIPSLPHWIKSIIFYPDCKFNGDMDFIPEGVTDLSFSNSKDHSIEEIKNFPSTLKIVQLGGLFNKKLSRGDLPKNLETLYFEKNYNQPFDEGVLPSGLINLNVGDNFNHPIEKNVLPNTLKFLTIGNKFTYPLGEGVLPESLQILIIKGPYNITNLILPKGVQLLHINGKNIDISKMK